MEILTLIIDTITTLNNIVEFFKSQNYTIYLNEALNKYLENIFYEVIFAREEAWIMNEFRPELMVLIDSILE
jgi:hypothetical protein